MIDLDFGMQSVIHLYLLLFVINSLCFWLSKIVLYFAFLKFLLISAGFQSVIISFFITVAEQNKCVQ